MESPVLIYTDDILVISDYAEAVLRDELGSGYDKFELKEESIGQPDQYLGGKLSLVETANNTKAWQFSSSQYVQEAVRNVEKYLATTDRVLPRKCTTPLSTNYRPEIDSEAIERAQRRLYAHSTTADYYKKWNLPIYYQLRFGEFCQRLDKALSRVQRDGWHADVFTGSDSDAKKIKESLGLELPVFFELYDTLLSMWKSTVYLRPLTHRFLRGAVQLVGRMLAFVRSGLNGEIEFGGTEDEKSEDEASSETAIDIPSYLWNERVDDIAVVAWELTILDTCMTHDYLQAITSTVCPSDEESRKATHNSSSEIDEIRDIASSVLMESSTDMYPLVTHSWNKLIVDNLTSQCSKPLSAVKGVAATYRMTNRPPPSQPSPFVASILRPLKDFDETYASRTPPQVGDEWKQKVIEEVSSKYSVAVEELIATVKRTEEALKNRKTRRMMVGGMSDNEKVKLQLFLDQREFKSNVEDVGINPESIAGIVKLGELTAEAASLLG